MEIAGQLDLLLHWARNTKRAQYAHYRMAHRYRRQYVAIGVTMTAMAVVCGSTVLADLSAHVPDYSIPIRIGTGLGVLLVSALSAIQTFLRLDERASLHLEAGAAYSAVKRHIDQSIASSKVTLLDSEQVNAIRQNMDDLGSKSPQVHDRVWHRTLQKMPALEYEDYELDKHLPTK